MTRSPKRVLLRRSLPSLAADSRVADLSLLRTMPAMLHSIDASGGIVDVSLG